MKRYNKKFLSLVLVAALTFSFISVPVRADDIGDGESQKQNLSQTEVLAAQTTVAEKPDNGTTTRQPFSAGTGGSQNFRIPAIVSLDDGTLVAACDARWNTTVDAGGLDTIVSRSTDGGATWSYTFANYLGDNGNVYNKNSATFIDPVLATDGKKVWMMVDLFPGGYALNSANAQPQAGTGFNSDGNMKIKKSGETEYNYYLKDGKIYSVSDNTEVAGYTVDAYYNLSYNDEKVSNVFFSDAAFQVFPAQYLYLTESTNDGATWSAPQILNVQVRTGEDQFYGTAPGAGTVLPDGTIVFPCYTWSSQKSSFIYSTDGGNTWTRSGVNGSSGSTSESAVVALDSNTIRVFARDYNTTVRYVDYKYSNGNWTSGSSVDTGITKTSNNQVSAIKYSKKIDGKDAIIISTAASGSSDRSNGKIYVFTLNDDDGNTMTKAYEYAVTSGTYQYSSLTEVSAASDTEAPDIALLYENGAASITYSKLSMSTIAPGATIGDTAEVPESPSQAPANPQDTPNTGNTEVTNTENVTLYVGREKIFTIDGANYAESPIQGLDTAIANVEVTGVDEGTSTEQGIIAATSVSTWNSYYIKNDNGQYFQSNGSWGDTAVKWNYITSRGNNYLQNNSNYVRYYNGWTITTNRGTPITVNNNQFYDRSNHLLGTAYIDGEVSVATPGSTTVKIAGIAAGITKAIVGNTKYNITVKAIDELNTENSPFVSGTGSFSGKTLTKLTISDGAKFDINLSTEFSGKTVAWTMDDTSIATVDVDGVVTGVTPGDAVLTAVVDGQSYQIPITVVKGSGTNSGKLTDIRISEIIDSDVYYSYNCSADLVQVQSGEYIYVYNNTTADVAFDFFAAPDDGYALTRMSATNAAGEYFALNGNKAEDTDFYNSNNTSKNGPIIYQKPIWGEEAIVKMITAAMDTGCDGALGFTRKSTDSGNIVSELTFRSEKLPTVEKSVVSITGTDNEVRSYTEGMTAVVGETVNFEVTVHKYSSQDEIDYSDVTVTENLNGALFNGDKTYVTVPLSSAGFNAQDYTYNVTYKVKDIDLDNEIINKVTLKYDYKAKYSTGSFDKTAAADAKFTAVSFVPKDIVIDFGLPVVIDYSEADAHGRYDLESGSATYGEVAVSGNKVTYTPTSVLLGADTVTLVNKMGAKYTFKVYPASNVYYEEGFAVDADGNRFANLPAGKTQSCTFVGDPDTYGYDEAYEAMDDSKADIQGQASFTFNGTGADIYTHTSSNSGAMSMWLYRINEDKTETLLKLGYVDTKQNWLSNSEGTFYDTPVFSYSGLEAGTYKVVMKVVSDSISLDGFRVYGTQGNAYNIYEKAGQSLVGASELRDLVISGVTINMEKINDLYKVGDSIISAVYDKTNTDCAGAIVLQKDDSGNTTDITVDENFINNGPKNEIYLENGQAIAFKLNDKSQKVVVGYRNLKGGGNASIKINDDEPENVNSTTDMFYTVTPNENGVVVVANSGVSPIALTKIMAYGQSTGTSNGTSDGNAGISQISLASLNTEAVVYALRCMGVSEAPKEAEAQAQIQLVDYTGKVLAENTLTASGEEGASTTFAKADVEALVNSLVPQGYALVDENAIKDVTTEFGKTETIKIQVGRTATLNVVYKTWYGRKAGTAVLTAVQTSAKGYAVFTPSQIRSAAPDKYRAGIVLSCKVDFGKSKTVTVIGY